MQQVSETGLHVLCLSNSLQRRVDTKINFRTLTPSAFACCDDKQLEFAIAAILWAETDRVIGQAEVDALRICAAANVPIFVVMAPLDLDDEDFERLSKFVRNTLEAASILVRDIISGATNPVAFWLSLSESERDNLERDADYRAAKFKREQSRREASLELEAIENTLGRHARMKAKCAEVERSLQSRISAVRSARAKALHTIDNAALESRIQLYLQENTKSSQKPEVIVQNLERAIEIKLSTWSDQIIEALLLQIFENANLSLEASSNKLDFTLAIPVPGQNSPSWPKVFRNSTSGLGLASLLSLSGIAIPALILVPAVLGVSALLIRSGHQEEKQALIIRNVTPPILESIKAHRASTRAAVEELSRLATETLQKQSSTDLAAILSEPDALADAEADLLAKRGDELRLLL
jgi:hypothetical protein